MASRMLWSRPKDYIFLFLSPWMILLISYSQADILLSIASECPYIVIDILVLKIGPQLQHLLK